GYTSTAATYTYSSSGGSWTGSSSIYLTKSSATVYGFYPSALTPAMNGTSSTVPVEIASAVTGFDVSGNTQTDYMYATASGINKTSSTASLTFYHGLTELSFIVNKGLDFSGRGTLSAIILTSSSSIAGSGTLSLADGTVSLTGSASTTISLSGTTIINDYSETASDNVVAAVLVAPLGSSSPDNATLVLTIDGVEYTGTITAPAWEAGNNYEYRVTISGGELTIDSSVNIADWTTTGPTDVDVS
ncbi:MAG: fimbrillin family protein, partial [Mangrovibacterium sp.]